MDDFRFFSNSFFQIFVHKNETLEFAQETCQDSTLTRHLEDVNCSLMEAVVAIATISKIWTNVWLTVAAQKKMFFKYPG